MLLTNIMDFMVKDDGHIDFNIKFHIPDYQFYKELGFPYQFNPEDGIILDCKGDCAILSLDLLDSREWEIIDFKETEQKK